MKLDFQPLKGDDFDDLRYRGTSLMNNTIAQQVEKWYAEHAASLSEISTKLRMTSIQPRDAMKGSVAIEIETPE